MGRARAHDNDLLVSSAASRQLAASGRAKMKEEGQKRNARRLVFPARHVPRQPY